jgi:hypothetical protein
MNRQREEQFRIKGRVCRILVHVGLFSYAYLLDWLIKMYLLRMMMSAVWTGGAAWQQSVSIDSSGCRRSRR